MTPWTSAVVVAPMLLFLAAPAPPPLFTDVATAAGLTFTHSNGATGRLYMPELIGAGVALFDYDNDGDLDVFLVQGGPLDSSDPGAEPRTSRLYRNDLVSGGARQRQLHFTDVTAAAGVGLRAYGMGTAVADYDNDGDLDLFVTAFGADTLYRNNGDGTFTDVTAASGVSDPLWSTSAAFFDYDRDGDLDLFVANYLDYTVAGSKSCTDATGVRDYCGPRTYPPAPDRLYKNDGQGRFTNVTDAAGISKADGAGLGVAVGDYNGDGWLDLYVANDATPNQLWINQHDGTFADEGLLSGAALNAEGNPEGSMGIASGDFDGDGDEDLLVTNIAGETFVLYRNDGHGHFDDARVSSGLAPVTPRFTGFGVEWFDYDNDGWLDVFAANGAVNIIPAKRGQRSPYGMTNLLLHNAGNGRLDDSTLAGGPEFTRDGVWRGAAFGDLDNDGDTDVVVTSNGGPVQLLLNGSPARHWLDVSLSQGSGNRFGLGARVGIERSGHATLWRRVKTDGSYLSASDSRAHFGLGNAPKVDAVIVQWPDGGTQRWTASGTDQIVTVRRTSTP